MYIKREFITSGCIILFGLSNNDCLTLETMRALVVAQSMRLGSQAPWSSAENLEDF